MCFYRPDTQPTTTQSNWFVCRGSSSSVVVPVFVLWVFFWVTKMMSSFLTTFLTSYLFSQLFSLLIFSQLFSTFLTFASYCNIYLSVQASGDRFSKISLKIKDNFDTIYSRIFWICRKNDIICVDCPMTRPTSFRRQILQGIFLFYIFSNIL